VVNEQIFCGLSVGHMHHLLALFPSRTRLAQEAVNRPSQ
jgi:hypothetical protein